MFQSLYQTVEAAVVWFVVPHAASARPPSFEEGNIMSTVLHKQSRSVTLRKQQLLILMILVLLTLLAITYFMLYTVAHFDPWHMVQQMAIVYRH